jgi:hypothetical protein
VGNLLIGRNSWVAGLFARLMYLSLYKMHERALHGVPKVTLDTLARWITRRTEPHVKQHEGAESDGASTTLFYRPFPHDPVSVTMPIREFCGM